MKSLFNKMFILLTVLALSSAFTIAQINWIKYSGNPLLNIHGSPGSWNQSVTVPCVIFNSDLNRYEMWFTAFTGATPNPGIGFTYSSDGITWSSPTLVMIPGPASWELLFVGGVSVIKEGSLYKMWYTGALPLRIGYATSPDGINWTKYSGNPVLSPGTGWESGGVAYPSVIKVPTGYWMFYSGEVSGGVTRTGRAFSTDGINWQKDTVHNPVLLAGGSGQWDQNNFLARVIEINDSLYMCYTAEAVPGNNSTSAIGFAKSADMGITWVKDAGNPIITQGTPGNWDYGRIETGSIIYTPSELRIYYDGSGPATGNLGRIGLATAPYELPLPPGTYTVGTNGVFATIQDAFDKLDTDGVGGEVTLELIDDLYTASTGQVGFLLYGPIPGAGPNKRVTIKPAVNKNVIIEGYNQVVIDLYNTSYTTIDGVGLSGSTTLTVHAYHNAQYQWNDCMGFYNDCDHNIIQNTTFISDDYTRSGSGLGLYTPTGYTSACDSNLIQYNFIPRGGWAMYLSANNSSLRATGNIIRGNKIGSETDSLIAWGIQIEHCQNTIVEDNIVQNLKITPNFGEVVNMGINSWWGSGDTIRNNVVRGIKSIAGYMSVGILLSGNGNDNIVYNNMVYDINSTSMQSSSRVSGIQIFNQNNPKIYYNSVYLSGTGANPLGSAALYIYTNVTNADIRNNILVNTRDESPYCASAIYDYSALNLTSDYNDIYYDDTNPDNCLVRIANTDYLTLAEWQATGKDLHSVTEKPHFILSDLHIYPHMSTLLDGHGTPIAEITTDFDNETRNSVTPDIGADEFEISSTILLTVNILDGWNMVSIPGLHPLDQNVDTWWAYRDQSADVFKYANGYHDTDYVTPGLGYWMKHSGTRTYNTGDEWPVGGIQVVEHNTLAGLGGWNLIGGYDLNVFTSGITTNPPDLQEGQVYKYSGGYQVATTLDPGYGYWIKLTGAGQIIIPGIFAKVEAREYFPESWGRIILTDATGVSYTLYVVNGKVDLNEYDLPPLPPVGVFDIRYASGRIAEDLSSAIQIIEMQGINYPITIKTEGVTITLQDQSGRIVNSILNPGEELTINNNSVNRLIILSGEVEKNIPTVFSLEQNYPNPFNPSTVISYQLPVSGDVILKIYDILGNEIATLVNEEKTAGKYEVEFSAKGGSASGGNAINLPSGVYFYQLRAGSFVETKKMVLLK